MAPPRILLSAFACDPYHGSDEEIGWQWARELSARGFDVTVLTRRSHQPAIERGIQETGHCRLVRFDYIDIGWLHSMVKHVNRRNHLYYYAWQVAAFRRARQHHVRHPFALIHHVTWYSFRQPSFMGLIGAPFYFGPVAGGDEIPPGYTADFSFKEKVVEAVRRCSNALVRFDPMMRLTFATATRIYFTSEAHLRRLQPSAAAKTALEFGIGCDLAPIAAMADVARVTRGDRLLFVGRCIGWKGMDIGLRILAQVRQRRPTVRLTVIGDGAERKRWMAKAHAMGLDDVIEWRGWIEKSAVLTMYAQYDAFFFPSLRDSGGFVVLEALQSGLPVVCFKLGGPGVVVDASCGLAVVAKADREETVTRFADAVIHVLELGSAAHDWQTPCRKRVENFTWESLIRRIYARFPAPGR